MAPPGSKRLQTRAWAEQLEFGPRTRFLGLQLLGRCCLLVYKSTFVSRDSMPCQSDEEDCNVGLPPPRRSREKMVGNSGADDEDSEEEVSDADLEKCLAHPKQRSGGPRKWNGRADYTLVKQWVTGEHATMEEEDIERELFELARDWMWASKLKKTPGHKSLPTDFAMWKQNKKQIKKKSGLEVITYRCPLLHHCNCMAGIRISRGPTYTQLDKISEHDAKSHDEDSSKCLKYNQIIAVVDAVRTAPTLSGAILRRNLQMAGPDSPGKKITADLLRSIRNRVRTAREQLTTDQLAGHAIDDSFGSLTRFSQRLNIMAFIDKHNDPDHAYHFDMFEPVVLGADIKVQGDLVYLQLSSPWFIFNMFRSMIAGWGTQLNGDATFNFCRSNLDMIGFGVNSMGAHNNPLTQSLCWNWSHLVRSASSAETSMLSAPSPALSSTWLAICARTVENWRLLRRSATII